MIAAVTTSLVKQAVKFDIFEKVTHFVVKNSEGECFRKVPAKVDNVGDYNKKFTLYLSENEANTIITELALVINGTEEPGTGTEISTTAWTYDKTIGLQSAYYFWTLEVQ